MSNEVSERWLADYITTYLERDLIGMGVQANPSFMRRVWSMLAHYHGQMMNLSEMGRSLQVSYDTIRRYVDILNGSFMVRILKPWFENLSKRQVKAPKIYMRDSGIFHSLMGVVPDQWMMHPKLGASWEGYALEEVIRFLNVNPDDCYFWRTEKGQELDLLVFLKGKRLGFESKYADAPQAIPSMHTVFDDLKLDSLTVINPGKESYPLTERIRVRGLEGFVRSL